jgi:lipid-A-disaccharide synthase
MLKAVERFPQYQVIITGAPSMSIENYKAIIKERNIPVLFGKTYAVLKNARAAVVTSGTATLETALLNVPQVVCYKASAITYGIGKHFVKVKFFSLVNIIMGLEVVKELLQTDLAPKIGDELDKILHNEMYRNEMFNNYQKLKALCGGSGASRRVAEKMTGELKIIQQKP